MSSRVEEEEVRHEDAIAEADLADRLEGEQKRGISGY